MYIYDIGDYGDLSTKKIKEKSPGEKNKINRKYLILT
jgi:hypothetical protein